MTAAAAADAAAPASTNCADGAAGRDRGRRVSAFTILLRLAGGVVGARGGARPRFSVLQAGLDACLCVQLAWYSPPLTRVRGVISAALEQVAARSRGTAPGGRGVPAAVLRPRADGRGAAGGAFNNKARGRAASPRRGEPGQGGGGPPEWVWGAVFASILLSWRDTPVAANDSTSGPREPSVRLEQALALPLRLDSHASPRVSRPALRCATAPRAPASADGGRRERPRGLDEGGRLEALAASRRRRRRGALGRKAGGVAARLRKLEDPASTAAKRLFGEAEAEETIDADDYLALDDDALLRCSAASTTAATRVRAQRRLLFDVASVRQVHAIDARSSPPTVRPAHKASRCVVGERHGRPVAARQQAPGRCAGCGRTSHIP